MTSERRVRGCGSFRQGLAKPARLARRCRGQIQRFIVVTLLAVATGCSGSSGRRNDAAVDTPVPDASPADAAPTDITPADVIPPDVTPDQPVCDGENPATKCRTAVDDCIPSGCSCSDHGWACTADCGGGRLCVHDGGADAGSGELCLGTGGTIETTLCCQTVSAFPNTCSVGACGCAPENSHSVSVCRCPAPTCFELTVGCALPSCTPGEDQTCNDDPMISSLHGHCLTDHVCVCLIGPGVNPATGRCR